MNDALVDCNLRPKRKGGERKGRVSSLAFGIQYKRPPRWQKKRDSSRAQANTPIFHFSLAALFPRMSWQLFFPASFTANREKFREAFSPTRRSPSPLSRRVSAKGQRIHLADGMAWKEEISPISLFPSNSNLNVFFFFPSFSPHFIFLFCRLWSREGETGFQESSQRDPP